MSYDQIFALSAQGMDVEKLRVDVVANNIANQHAVLGANGKHFQPMRVLSQAIAFENYLQDPNAPQGGIQNIELVEEQVSPNKEYHPGHPAADPKGFVTYPGVNTIDEMTTMLRASRAYEANVKLLGVAKTMALQALSIGEER